MTEIEKRVQAAESQAKKREGKSQVEADAKEPASAKRVNFAEEEQKEAARESKIADR